MSTSHIPAPLLTAYRHTAYRVEAPRPFVLRIGLASPALHQLHRQAGVASSAFIPACNPRSRLLADSENAERQQHLAEAIACGGWRSLPGSGKHISGPWPAEASFLVLGIARHDACRLARAFDQNAIVFCGENCIPELVMLR